MGLGATTAEPQNHCLNEVLEATTLQTQGQVKVLYNNHQRRFRPHDMMIDIDLCHDCIGLNFIPSPVKLIYVPNLYIYRYTSAKFSTVK